MFTFFLKAWVHGKCTDIFSICSDRNQWGREIHLYSLSFSKLGTEQSKQLLGMDFGDQYCILTNLGFWWPVYTGVWERSEINCTHCIPGGSVPACPVDTKFHGSWKQQWGGILVNQKCLLLMPGWPHKAQGSLRRPSRCNWRPLPVASASSQALQPWAEFENPSVIWKSMQSPMDKEGPLYFMLSLCLF